MNSSDILFYVLAIASLASALGVVLITNPIYSALMLAISMSGLAALFFSLEAYFLAGVQLIVYAGAVVVLFVMVIMLFDLRKENQAFSGNKQANLLKLAVMLVSLVMLALPLSALYLNQKTEPQQITTQNLAMSIFTKYIFAFEMIGVLLLVVLVGAMALAKSRGGTHE
jgi:NADH-quinone oxidoreductase subunit J